MLGDCLDSLERQTLRPAETIVVDAGSTDGSAHQARSRGARVIATENRGIGHLYNVGARAATGDFVLFANNDVALAESCLELLVAQLAGHDGRFAADPRQRDWDDTRDIHARTTLTRAPLLRRPLPGFDLDQTRPASDVTPTLMANGGVFLASRQRFLELGGFDESFFMEWEDTDLSWRAWARGWEVVYVPQAVAAPPSRRRHDRERRSAATALVAPQPAALRAQVLPAVGGGACRRRRAAQIAGAPDADRARVRARRRASCPTSCAAAVRSDRRRALFDRISGRGRRPRTRG